VLSQIFPAPHSSGGQVRLAGGGRTQALEFGPILAVVDAARNSTNYFCGKKDSPGRLRAIFFSGTSAFLKLVLNSPLIAIKDASTPA
jgi:hypothetical protein